MSKKNTVTKDKDKVMVAQQILEVRHEPSGSFLDVRGYVADYIRASKLFQHWNIEANVVQFRDMADKILKDGAFAGYKTAGYVVNNPDTHNYFVDKASAFWKMLLKNNHYSIPTLTRFGARTKVFIPSTMSFDKINNLMFETFFTERARKLIGGTETDLLFSINLNESHFQGTLQGGPVREKEASNYLNFESEHLKNTGIFLDIDYFKTKDLSNDIIPELLREAVALTWAKVENISANLGL